MLSEATGDPQKASGLMVGIEARETCVSEGQEANVSFPIEVTEAGSAMEAMAVHLKALYPMLSTAAPRVTEAKK